MRRHGIRFAALLLLVGCGGGTTTPPPPTAAGLTAAGWADFEAKDYGAADSNFVAALNLDATFSDAQTGRGWVAVRGGNYADADTRFQLAVALDPGALDALGGLVLARGGLDDPAGVIARGEAVLAASATFAFSHDASFAASDVRWLIARAALDTADYPRLIAQLDVLQPGHGLSPDQVDFPERALALLEALRETV